MFIFVKAAVLFFGFLWIPFIISFLPSIRFIRSQRKTPDRTIAGNCFVSMELRRIMLRSSTHATNFSLTYSLTGGNSARACLGDLEGVVSSAGCGVAWREAGIGGFWCMDKFVAISLFIGVLELIFEYTASLPTSLLDGNLSIRGDISSSNIGTYL